MVQKYYPEKHNKLPFPADFSVRICTCFTIAIDKKNGKGQHKTYLLKIGLDPNYLLEEQFRDMFQQLQDMGTKYFKMIPAELADIAIRYTAINPCVKKKIKKAALPLESYKDITYCICPTLAEVEAMALPEEQREEIINNFKNKKMMITKDGIYLKESAVYKGIWEEQDFVSKAFGRLTYVTHMANIYMLNNDKYTQIRNEIANENNL